ncbi:MAG: RNA 2',3'-cyclic phosphodiesterase [Proteobacteria bacterium]|nr:RNA 2',3'-cyclic phosphodiesterase [Pseudomonadota bacterium]
MPDPDRERRRVFFALWPDEPTLERLDQIGKQLHALGGGRRMRRETLHMTLAFIGEVPPARIKILRQAAGRVAAPAFSLRLDRLDCWRHNRIAWAGCSDPPLQLLTLVGQLYERLEAAGLPLETGDFAAHMTLLRNVHYARCEPLPELEPIDWPVAEFVLVESRLTPEGPHYGVIDRWPLAQGVGT